MFDLARRLGRHDRGASTATAIALASPRLLRLQTGEPLDGSPQLRHPVSEFREGIGRAFEGIGIEEGPAAQHGAVDR